MTGATRRAVIFLLLALALPTDYAGSANAQAQSAWPLLSEPGHAVFMRHADAPGFADPEGYRVDDCSTQRNLSDGGREQARRIGEALRNRGVAFQRVLTSPWCRCKDTAVLVTGREAEIFGPLSNLIGRSQHTSEQVAALKAFLAALQPDTRALLVTHGVVINALTGINPATGEMIIVKLDATGAPAVAGRLRAD